ncbi:MAG: tetratricopeptide repeat protein [Acidobacteriia bacterium]|jgi:Tfp pilus assembly protein PilF|nr:tetratricopeptide repeat protein [Terriglobia bacterium]
MRRAAFWFWFVWVLCGPVGVEPAAAQVAIQSPVGGVIIRGQVYGPDGLPFRKQIRLEVREQSPRSRPEYIYTDTLGRFEFQGRTQVIQIIRVESDGESYAETVVDFIPSGISPFVHVYLRRLEKPVAPKPEESITSAAALTPVPRGARREFERGVELMQKNRPAEARARFEAAIQLFPDYVEAYNELAVLLLREGQLEAAEVHLRRALEIDPAAANVLLNLGLCLVRRGRPSEAVRFLDRAVQLQPRNAPAQLLYGVALFLEGREDLAEPVLLRAYELGGKQVSEAQYHLARIYLKRNDAARAARALETYLQDTPNAPNAAQLQETLRQLQQTAKKPQTEAPQF